MNTNEIQQFLIKANRNGYGNDSIKPVIESDGSRTIIFEDNDYKFHDNYFGGEPFGGREVISYKNKTVWIMVYYGSIIDISHKQEITATLKNALMLFSDDLPYRGPEMYENGKWIYLNKVGGEFSSFYGEEIIKHNNNVVYRARYQGGIVDR